MTCHGNGDDHCCYVEGAPCVHLTSTDDRKWACGLLVELGSWEAVHADLRYLETPRPVWIQRGVPDCGDWLGPGCCFGREREEEALALYRKAAQRPGTPLAVRLRAAAVSGHTETGEPGATVAS